MKQRLASRWFAISDSLWFIPTVLTLLAIVLAWGTVRIDEYLIEENKASSTWLFGAGAEGARGVLSAIAGPSAR